MSREEIIAANPIVDFLCSRGHELRRAGKNFVTNASPVTQHKRGHRRVMIYPENNSWFDHGLKKGGSVIDWVMHEKSVTAAEAMRELAGGLSGSEHIARFAKTSPGQSGKAPAANHYVTFDWSHNCVAPLTPKELIRLGNERWYSRQFCTWLHDKKYVGLVHGDFAFPIQDHGNILAAHYRVKAKQVGEKDDWFYFPTGIGARPFVIGDLTKAKQAHIGESQWDMLALADRTGLYLNQNHAFIATRGAGNAALCNGLIPEGVSVLAWPQNDEAAKRWLDDLSIKVPVHVTRAIVPEQFKDLNEWTKAGASAEDIYAAIFRNELVEKPEIAQPVSEQQRQSTVALLDLLDSTCAFLRRHIVFSSPAQPLVIALWIAHTWVLDAFDYTPYLHIWSPEKRCGKTKLLDCLELLAAKIWRAVSPSEAVLYRKIECDGPTLLLDEVDTVFSGNKDERKEPVRALLNAGFERKAQVPRCVGQGSNYQVQEFAVFCAKAFAGIGRLPDTVSDRCIPIRLIRRSRHELVQRFRKREAETATSTVRAALETWSQQNGLIEKLRASRPEIPKS